jgi:hypothetical protein
MHAQAKKLKNWFSFKSLLRRKKSQLLTEPIHWNKLSKPLDMLTNGIKRDMWS